MTVEEIRDFLGVNSLAFLPIDEILEATDGHPQHFCLACSTTSTPPRSPATTRPATTAPATSTTPPRSTPPRHTEIDHGECSSQ